MGKIDDRKTIEQIIANDEQIALLGDIRDQLKRIADVVEKLATAELILPVEIGEPTIRVKEPLRK
jgi:hypothetical protein